MAEFVNDQASESDRDENDTDVSEDSQPAAKRAKKQKKQKRKQQISSDEEDEEDEAAEDALRSEEMKGFVVEEDEEEEEEGDDNRDEDQSDRANSDEDDLLEDDLDLLDENIGRKKGGRVEMDSDEEDDRERIKNDIFDQEDDEGGDQYEDRHKRVPREYDEEEEASRSGSEQSEGEFIVNDDGMDRKRNKGKKGRVKNQFLDDAKDVFGVEDIDEFYDDEEGIEDEGEEGEECLSAKPRTAKVSLWNTIEPSELDKGFVGAADKRIIFEDRPERFQMRKIPVTEVDDHELDLETAWVHEYAFKAETISKQQGIGLSILSGPDQAASYKGEMEAPDKIKEAIRFIRNQHFEVPFIAFYRKEYVESSLHMSDLWKVYQYDEKWCRLQQRKLRVLDLLKRVQQYIVNCEGTDSIRKVTEKDFNDVTGVQTAEELADVYAHFQLYYGSEMSRVHEWEQNIAKEKLDSTFVPKFKLCGRTDKYLLCIQCGLGPMAQQFGLTPEEFSENFTEYVKHEVRQDPLEPVEVAKDYINDNFPTTEDVLKGAAYVLAQQFSREPAVRKKLRGVFRQRLKFSIYPTKKGRDDIDESHPLWNKHYIKDKPVADLRDDEYLQYIRAKNDGLVEIKLYADTEQETTSGATILESLFKDSTIFHRDEYFYVVEEWNKLRKEILRMCVNDFLVPVFEREAHERLYEEARECVLRKCSAKLLDALSTEAYKPTLRYPADEDDVEDSGTRVMGICYSPDRAEASFALVIDQDGMVLDYIRLVHFNKRIFSKILEEANLKKEDMNSLRKLILRRQPHIIAINGEDLEAVRLAQDVRNLVKTMLSERDLTGEIPVEIVDNDAAKVYMNSRSAMQEYPVYPPLLRQAVSLARFVLDPLIEICHLCNGDEDVLFMKFHPLQSELPKRDLLFALQLECINRVNEVGVDINRCLEFPHTAGLLQFVCGLGPRKASHLLKILKQNDNLLESRTKLVTFCRMGPKVFMNASGFIKIDTTRVSERTDAYVEVLDGSRVHPETYEWARKMAVDALEIDDPADPTGALEEILQCPDRLKDLDLDAFAEELARQGFGNKSITLYDIRAELNYRYKDLRSPHKTAQGKELYEMLVKDSDTCAEGKLVNGRILFVVHRKPGEKDTSTRQPKHNNQRNTWECDFCKRDDFTDISQVWNHTDNNDCPGIPVGVKVRLDNGILGFVGLKNISDTPDSFRNPAQRLVPGRDQIFRVMSFNTEKMQCELSCRTSDLQRSNETEKDTFFDHQRCQKDKEVKEKERNAQSAKNQFVKRVISHPSFHNVTFKDAERMLRGMDPGDAIVRPSGSSAKQLTITWKVADTIYQHINIREENKERVFDIGKILFINNEPYEDLDEIIARYIQPMAGFARDIMTYKYYMDGCYSEDTATIEAHLVSEKQRTPSKIPYTLTASQKYPAKFVLSYLAQQKVRHEYLSATPEGIKFRYQMFNSTEELINWFKLHYMHRPEVYKK